MKNFFQKQREIMIIFVYVIVIAALFYFVILPLLSKIEGVNNEIQEESMKQEIVRQQLANLPKIQQQYDVLQENEGSIDVLLDKDKAVVLIESLEKLAQDSGNNIEISVQTPPAQKSTAVKPGKKTLENVLVDALPSTDYLQMQIKLTGDYNKIVDFIGRLENMEYYSDIIGIQIGENDTASGAVVINPFSSVKPADSEKISNQGDLKATLDVVFYIKK
jgi:Tfp pilus assembly protein PilO